LVYLFIAYIVLWAGVFLYLHLLSRRLKGLEMRLGALERKTSAT